MPNTSHYRIFDYWKDKIITPSGEVMAFKDRKPGLDYEVVVYDWGEPCCWACGERAIGDDELSRFFDAHPDTVSHDFFKKLYALKPVRSHLNRCHIVPNALNGPDSPENLFLMCEECHALSPDTINLAAFFRWVYDRKKKYIQGRLHPREVIRRIDDELSRRGLPPLVECLSMAKSPFELTDIEEFMRDRVGFHCSHITESSLIVGATDWILHDWLSHLLGDDNQSQCG